MRYHGVLVVVFAVVGSATAQTRAEVLDCSDIAQAIEGRSDATTGLEAPVKRLASFLEAMLRLRESSAATWSRSSCARASCSSCASSRSGSRTCR
jgi:hypothetical protein